MLSLIALPPWCVSKRVSYLRLFELMWLPLLFYFGISFTLVYFRRIDSESDCTNQTRSLIDQISMQQGRIVDLEGGLDWFTLFLYIDSQTNSLYFQKKKKKQTVFGTSRTKRWESRGGLSVWPRVTNYNGWQRVTNVSYLF